MDLKELELNKMENGVSEEQNQSQTPLIVPEKKEKISPNCNPAFQAVKDGKLDVLKLILSSTENKLNVMEKDEKEKTILHWAVTFWSRRIAKKMMISILDYAATGIKDKEEARLKKKELADTQDENGETALHLAAKKGRVQIVLELLDVQPDWNIRAKEGEGGHKTALDHIYAHVPEAVIKQLDNSIKYVEEMRLEGDDKNELKYCEEMVELDFGSIIGGRKGPDEEDNMKEANRLGGLMTDSAGKFTPILEHPLVQVFLSIKYEKAYNCILASMAAHIIWQLIYGYFLFDIYFNVCPWKQEKAENSSDIETKMECDGNNLVLPGLPLALLVWLLGGIFLVKELFELCTVPWTRYFSQLENIGQMFAIFSVVLTCWPVYEYLAGNKNPLMVPWQYVLAAAAEFTAWALILGQVCKLLPLRIYIQIFVKVFKSFVMFITTFAALLLGFASAFCIMMPEAKAFKSPWLAVPKVLVMMTGELNYDDVFHNEGDEAVTGLPAHYVTTQVLFSLFTIIMSLILLNLLIGLAVSDTQELKENCHIAELSSMLEEVYLLESFAVRLERTLKFPWLLNRLKISEESSNPVWLKKTDSTFRKNCVTLEFANAADYPFTKKLMDEMRSLADKKVFDHDISLGIGSSFSLNQTLNQENINRLVQANVSLLQELKKKN